MDNKYNTIFSSRNSGHFANIGKASLTGSSDYLQTGNGARGGKALPAVNDSDLAMKFFEGDDMPVPSKKIALCRLMLIMNLILQ